MGKLSVRSLSFASGVAFVCCVAHASASAPVPQFLEQGDLANPDRVAAWLKRNAATADKATAQRFFDRALKDKARKAWGPAGKGFCESALSFPAPQALSECANAVAHSLGSTRTRDKSYAGKGRDDMRHVERLYRSALAADAVLAVLGAKDKEQVARNADCVAEFVRAEKIPLDCPPLQAYGLR